MVGKAKFAYKPGLRLSQLGVFLLPPEWDGLLQPSGGSKGFFVAEVFVKRWKITKEDI